MCSNEATQIIFYCCYVNSATGEKSRVIRAGMGISQKMRKFGSLIRQYIVFKIHLKN